MARARALSVQSPSSTWKKATTVAFDDAWPGGGAASIAVVIADLRHHLVAERADGEQVDQDQRPIRIRNVRRVALIGAVVLIDAAWS